MVKKEDKNKVFTTGEETILEQASMILNKRKNIFYSKQYNYTKHLILGDEKTLNNEKQLLKIISDIQDIKTNSSSNNLLLNKLFDRLEKYIKLKD